MASDRNSKNRANYEKLMKPHQEIQDIKQDIEAISKTVQSVSDSLNSFKALQEAENKAIHTKIDDTALTLKKTFQFQIRDAKKEFQEKLDEQGQVHGITFKSINDKFDKLLDSHNQKIDTLKKDYDTKIEKINQEYSNLSADTTKNADEIKQLGIDYKAEINNLDIKYNKVIQSITADTERRFDALENEANNINNDLLSLKEEIETITKATTAKFNTLEEDLKKQIQETNDYFDTKLADYTKVSAVEEIKTAFDARQSDLNTELQALRSEYEKKVEVLTNDFQSKIDNGSSNLTTLQNSLTTLQQEYLAKANALDTKIEYELTLIKSEIGNMNEELNSFKISIESIQNNLTSEATRIEQSIDAKLANYLQPKDLDALKAGIGQDIENQKIELTKLIDQYKSEVETVKTAQELYVLKTEFETSSQAISARIDAHIQTTEQKIQSLSTQIETTEKALYSLSNEVLHIKNKTLNEFTSKIIGIEGAISKFITKEELTRAEENIQTKYEAYLDSKASEINTKIEAITNVIKAGEINKQTLESLTKDIADLQTSQSKELATFLDLIKTNVDTKFKDSFEVFSKHISALSQHESKITKESIAAKFAISSACNELLNNSFSKLSLYTDSEDKQKLQTKINELLSELSKNYFAKIDSSINSDAKDILSKDGEFYTAFNSHLNNSTEQDNDELSFENAITTFENNTLQTLEGLKSIAGTKEFKDLELQINNEIEYFAKTHNDLNELTTFYLKDVYTNILIIDTLENVLHPNDMLADQITSINTTLNKL